MKNLKALALFSGLAMGGLVMPATAAVLVDGTLDAAYGGPSAVVTYNAAAPNGNFGAPTSETAGVGYSIYVSSDASYWYGFFQADPLGGGTSAGTFANLYFDLDPANGNGSDLGFELSPGTQDAFVPGMPGNVLTPGVMTAAGTNSFEVAIPVSYFTGPIAGLTYYPAQEFISASSPDLVLRLSQTFGYSVAGGSTYGNDRLGRVSLSVADVPEPLTLSVFSAGLVGAAAIRRRKKAARK
jgi:hypothetical protein